MTLDKEQLEMVTELAKIPIYTPAKIAKVMELDPREFVMAVMEEDSDIGKAYHSGKLSQDVIDGTAINRLAKQGSSPAQILQVRLKKEAEVNRFREFYE